MIRQLNSTIGESEDATIALVRWETHAWPGFGEDAQAVINRQIEPGDIFVGILWRRIGTATKRHLSGTIEELHRAYGSWEKTGRPTMMLSVNTARPATTRARKTSINIALSPSSSAYCATRAPSTGSIPAPMSSKNMYSRTYIERCCRSWQNQQNRRSPRPVRTGSDMPGSRPRGTEAPD